MAERSAKGIRTGMVRFLRHLLALDPGPGDLAEEVADRLMDKLTPDQRMRLRNHFGVDPGVNAELEEIDRHLLTRACLRKIESRALIRLYRWTHRKARLPSVQQRLMSRIAAANEEILEALCDAPPVRPVLVGWHDQLIDGRRCAAEIAALPRLPGDEDCEDEPQTQEALLAAMLREALWANARARKPVRGMDSKPTVRRDERDKALATLRDLHLNAQSILAAAAALLGPARRIEVESDAMIPQLLAPVIDPDAPSPPGIPPDPPPHFRGDTPDIAEVNPALANAVTVEAGMPIAELWARACHVDQALMVALHNQRLLVDSCMPVVAEISVAQALRGKHFFDGIEKGRDAVRELADGFCFPPGGDFTVRAEQSIRAALQSGEAAEF